MNCEVVGMGTVTVASHGLHQEKVKFLHTDDDTVAQWMHDTSYIVVEVCYLCNLDMSPLCSAV